MINGILNKILGDPNEKKIKKYLSIIEDINKYEETFKDFTIENVQSKTKEFKQRFEGLDFKKEEDSKKIKKILEEIKLEAFALVKYTCKLILNKEFTLPSGKNITWNMVPYDVQLVGALSINDGNISEMKTGEGKTLVATMPAYLNALTGNTVSIVTVNDYLAKRDSEEMGVLYKTLGLSVGVVTHDQAKKEKQEAYKSDILYATNNELGFDYLRDNMVIKNEDKSQSPLFFCIIDEVDSILVDEARTPLIISAPDNEPTSKYLKFAKIVKNFNEKKDYKIDEKQKTAILTEEGIEKVEKMLGVENIYISAHYNDLHHIENAIRAHSVYKKDKDYILKDGEVMIVDEFTGRVLSGRRYSNGLHQAIEAKENVDIKEESRTLASITFQNYFRLYWKLSGMTGTAKTEEEEFYKVYGLDVVVIPTNKPIARFDNKDLLFKNETGKFDYLLNLIKDYTKTGQPVLIGTVSVDKSEYLSSKLKKAGIKHNVLNAKQHDSEAEIVAGAGQKGAITIATNMAGRGTDIKLGEGVKELGGLAIIGTEKHETRRIDNQLRGRSGRQGDPGFTRFLVSPNDDIMRIFGGDKLFSIFNSPIFASLPEDEPLTDSAMLTRRITSVQKQVEGHNFDIRKHVLEYDDVINQHRAIIYSRRDKILRSEDIDLDVREMIENQISSLLDVILLDKDYSDWNLEKIKTKVNDFLSEEVISDISKLDDFTEKSDLKEYIYSVVIEELNLLQNTIGKEQFLEIERRVVLQSIDELWMRHIDEMSKLREAVAFEGYAQRNPLIVYKEKAYEKFVSIIGEVEYKTTKAMFSIRKNSNIEQIEIKEEDLSLLRENSPNPKQNTAKPAKIVNNANPLFTSGNSEKDDIKIVRI